MPAECAAFSIASKAFPVPSDARASNNVSQLFDGGKRQEFNRLPAGFETELGVGGALLSTGQKQRLSIARAVVRDSRVLILDEPTARHDGRYRRFVELATV